MISPLDITTLPTTRNNTGQNAAATASQPTGAGPFAATGPSAQDDAAIIDSLLSKGLTNVSDLLSGSRRSPIPAAPPPRTSVPSSFIPRAAVPFNRDSIDSIPSRRAVSMLPAISTNVTDDRDSLPSAIARRSASASASTSASTSASASASASPTTPTSRAMTPRERARHQKNKSSKWYIPGNSPEEEDKPSPSTSTNNAATANAPKPRPAQETSPAPNFVHPVPTKPEKFFIDETSDVVVSPSEPQPHDPLECERQQPQYSTGSRVVEAHIPLPSSPNPPFQAYMVEPPRLGPGFDGRAAHQHPSGHPARSHHFIAPQLLRPGESQEIIKTYNAFYNATEDTFRSLLSRHYRFPPYTRDEAARLRKLEFERTTGESMADDAYFALFDLETSNDGMLSALLEWMQGRTWVKAPFVNRIIHQLCRLMYTSAREEARLRLKFRRDCDGLKERLEAAGEESALGRLRNSWERLDAAVKRQQEFVKMNVGEWSEAEEEVERKCDEDVDAWKGFANKFSSHLRNRQDLEDTIKGQGEVLKEDLGQLKMVRDDIGKDSEETTAWLRNRTDALAVGAWFQTDRDGLLFCLSLLNDEVEREDRERRSAVAAFADVAARRHALRWRYANSMGDNAEEFPEPTVPNLLDKYMDEMRIPLTREPLEQADGSMSSESGNSVSTAQPPPDDPSAFHNLPSQTAALQAQAQAQAHTKLASDDDSPNTKPPCTRCQSLEGELKAKELEVAQGYHAIQSRDNEISQMETALEAIKNDEIEKAVGQIRSYRDLVHAEMCESLHFLSQMLEMHGQRAHDQSDLLEASFQAFKAGGSLDGILEELQPTIGSVRRLASAVLLLQSEASGIFDDLVSDKGSRLLALEKEGSPEGKHSERLIQSLRQQVEDLTSRTQQSMESHATTKLDLAKSLQEKLEAESDKLREQIRECQNRLDELEYEAAEREKNTQQEMTDDRAEERLLMGRRLGEREAELQSLELQNKTLEEQASIAEEMVAVLSKAKRESDEATRKLEGHITELQAKLEARVEAGRWSWGTSAANMADDLYYESQRNEKISQLRKELLAELGNAASSSYLKMGDSEMRRSLPGLMSSILWSKRPLFASAGAKANQPTEEDIQAFWRLITFQRRRAEAVAALKQNDMQVAFNKLIELRAWDTELGPWQTEAQTIEVRRSLNYLQSYANSELVKGDGAGEEASPMRLEAAKVCLNLGQSLDGANEAQGPWESLKRYLQEEPGRGADQEYICDCKYKALVCQKHQREGGIRLHNFMEVEGSQQAEIELTQEASDLLQPYGYTVSS
ncbi:hypothetical protein EsH8_V_000784 [Colletotrichum jinshuiense]